ncbi:MAG: hypothetical protein Q8N99_06460 [Nanoarchaeota archaeon]|nr:hypothetical protein [Nanoarchaeota archaeon]
MKFLRKIARELLLKKRSPARYDLERKIFPKIKQKKILLVGIADYIKNYPDKLKENEIWTLDIDPNVAKYGSKNHIIGDVSVVDKYFSKNFLDYIFLCGVIGCGLNDIIKTEKAINNSYKILKPKGILVVGWDSGNTKKWGFRLPLMDNLKINKKFNRTSRFGFPIGYKYGTEEKYYSYDFLEK